MTPRAARRPNAGFTMMETLLAVLLMGIILAALATITSQWLRNWDRGLDRVQGVDLLAAGIDRLVADLSSAEFVSPGADDNPIFEGSENGVTFVRTPIGPNSFGGLEVVRIAEATDSRGTALVRTTAAFRPGGSGNSYDFANPVVLVRAPYRISFSYSGADLNARSTWQRGPRLPRTVTISMRGGPSLATATTVTIRAELPARCAAVKTPADCLVAPTTRLGSGG